jgi:hypothetical protein
MKFHGDTSFIDFLLTDKDRQMSLPKPPLSRAAVTSVDRMEEYQTSLSSVCGIRHGSQFERLLLSLTDTLQLWIDLSD